MQNSFARKQKKKEFVMVLLICMVCLSAVIWGTAAFSKRNMKNEKESPEDIINLNETTNQALAETDGTGGEEESVNSPVVKQTGESDGNPDKITDGEERDGERRDREENVGEKTTTSLTVERENTEDLPSEDNSGGGTDKVVQDGQPETTIDTRQVNSQVANLSFNQESVLMWPVEGNVILGFNMDSTIYFPTLDSYRCNPAMVIQGDLGMDVISATKGCVSKIGTDSEIGNYVVMNLGNDYELTYGQLKDICVKEGDYVAQAQKIACVAEPSKYYINEGVNLYLKLTQAGKPVDPLDYLE